MDSLQFEYITVSVSVADSSAASMKPVLSAMNDLGKSGWELVNTVLMGLTADHRQNLLLFFKRER